MNLAPTIQAFVLHFGEMGSRWGINRTVGQIYALLFVTDRPLNADEIGCGFFHPDATTPGLSTHLLLRERNGVLLPSDHPLASRSVVRLRDLGTTPFVFFPRLHNPGFYDRMLAAFSRAGITPRIAEEVWPRANGIGLVRAGLGATFMCPSEAQHLPPEVTFRPLEGPAPESRLVIGWKAAATLPPAAPGSQ